MTVKETHPIVTPHIVVYLDLLGFSNAIVSANAEKQNSILRLLKDITDLNGEYFVEPLKEGKFEGYSFAPAISTFSDNIIISYPASSLSAPFPNETSDRPTMFSVLNHFEQLCGNIARAALRAGFLVRGGCTIGDLYHKRGTVFGNGLVEAYRLESSVATYPRIVASNALIEHIPCERSDRYYPLLHGEDGMYHLNYYQWLLGAPLNPRESIATTNYLYNYFTDIVKNSADKLRKQNRQKDLAKWLWFASEFRTSLARREHPLYHYLSEIDRDRLLIP